MTVKFRQFIHSIHNKMYSVVYYRKWNANCRPGVAMPWS